MIKRVYAIRDVKTSWLNPVIDVNDNSARRNFAYMINNSGDVSGFAPADFSLFYVGDFDSETGVITGKQPEYICSGSDCIGG